MRRGKGSQASLKLQKILFGGMGSPKELIYGS
jgi:hypothetical protein